MLHELNDKIIKKMFMLPNIADLSELEELEMDNILDDEDDDDN